MIQPVRILCVDDNRLMAEAMERGLAADGFLKWVGWVSDSAEAVTQAQKTSPDVVLLDIDMPGQDSFTVLRSLVQSTPAIRVVMLSGHVRLEYIERAIDGGAWGYLSKNESMEDLFDAIKRVATGEFVLSPEVEAEYRCNP